MHMATIARAQSDCAHTKIGGMAEHSPNAAAVDMPTATCIITSCSLLPPSSAKLDLKLTTLQPLLVCSHAQLAQLLVGMPAHRQSVNRNADRWRQPRLHAEQNIVSTLASAHKPDSSECVHAHSRQLCAPTRSQMHLASQSAACAMGSTSQNLSHHATAPRRLRQFRRLRIKPASTSGAVAGGRRRAHLCLQNARRSSFVGACRATG